MWHCLKYCESTLWHQYHQTESWHKSIVTLLVSCVLIFSLSIVSSIHRPVTFFRSWTTSSLICIIYIFVCIRCLTGHSLCFSQIHLCICILLCGRRAHFNTLKYFFCVVLLCRGLLLLIGKTHRGFMSCFNLCVLIYKSVCWCVWV